jgi:uncharacterized Tic20 family protein
MQPDDPTGTPGDGPGQAQAGGATPGGTPTKEERTWGMVAHLLGLSGYIVPMGNVLGPLVLWLARKDDSAFVADQARESLNFQITMLIAALISAALLCVFIGIFLLAGVVVIDLVFVIIAAMRANEGELYRYPWTLRLVR